MCAAPTVESADLDRAATGIQILDEQLHGGFPRRSILLLFSEIPAEKRVFAEHFVMAGVKNNESCLYVDFYRAPQLARREFMQFGPYPASKLVLVDATSTQLLLPSSEKYVIEDMGTVDKVLSVVVKAIKETKPKRIVIDSVEFLADRFPEGDVLDFWRKLAEEAGAVGSTLCFLFINWRCGSPELAKIKDMADILIEFRSTIDAGVVRNAMRIEETRDGGLKTNWVPYTFKDLSGVTVYFPRILVTGPLGAGKSTVVKNLCNTSVNIERVGTTVAFDYGNVDLTGLEAELLGTPGQEKFESIFKVFARELNGMILVVDASKPQDLGKARRMLDLVGPGIPFVVLANKSDVTGALSPAEVKESMRLAVSDDVVSSVATTGVGLKQALKLLAEHIIGAK